jgi:hypothetical protein
MARVDELAVGADPQAHAAAITAVTACLMEAFKRH